MKNNTARLYFIDAMRAWAILMMLQGHFVDGLLDTAFKDDSNTIYTIWRYFRGVTAPVFFTLSGFIFTFLLVKGTKKGFNNPRVKKGIKRGLQLVFIGYLLRINVFGLLIGEIYNALYLIDVLHCIGFSILGIIGIYLLTKDKRSFLLPLTLLTITCLLFLFEPYYKLWSFDYFPKPIANYFTKVNGSIFTIFPWFGYATFGGFLSILFTRYKNSKYLYTSNIIIFALVGLALIFLSSDIFVFLNEITGIHIFFEVSDYNYLFIRLGDVLVVFSIFMLLRQFLINSIILRIGQNTLSIYIIHFILLYGSFTGLGLYQFFNHSLSPLVLILGALVFMFACSYSALLYEKKEVFIKAKITAIFQNIGAKITSGLLFSFKKIKSLFVKIFRPSKN